MKKPEGELRMLLTVFGPISVLLAVLVFFQFKAYNTHKERLEDQLSRQQALITAQAAESMRDYVGDISWKLDELAGIISETPEPLARRAEFEREFGHLMGRIRGLAYYGVTGRLEFFVTRDAGLMFAPEEAGSEDFFTEVKKGIKFYASRLKTLPDGGEFVYFSCPVKEQRGGRFMGVVVALADKGSFESICSKLEDEAKWDISYFDQAGNKLCYGNSGDAGVARSLKAGMPPGGPVATIVNNKDTGRVRYLEYPIKLDGLPWYVTTTMPLSGIDDIVKGDFVLLLGLTAFFTISLVFGGLYFRKVYKGKALAEAEAARQSFLAAQGAILAEEKEKLSAVLNNIPDGVMLMDDKGRVMEANTVMRAILGISMHGSPSEEITALIEGSPWQSLTGKADNGTEVEFGGTTYKIISMPVTVPGRDSLTEVRVVRDISGEKALEQRKRDLVSMITHDIKSPLTAIIGLSQWMGQGGEFDCLGKDGEDALESIGFSAKRILHLMDNFVMLSSVEGSARLDMRPVELTPFLNAAVVEFQLMARKKNISLDCRLVEPSPVLHVDEGQMSRALANLLVNALNYTPEGGSVSVSASVSGGHVSLSVSDSGPGIEKEELPHVFDRYYRAKSTCGGVKGSGLGLAIAKAVVEAHGGSIEAKSEAGQGSTFTLSLPLHSPSKIN